MLSRANFSAEPSDVSLLWALWDMKAAGGMSEMNSAGEGTQVILPERQFEFYNRHAKIRWINLVCL
jgi:hypothetical protein